MYEKGLSAVCEKCGETTTVKFQDKLHDAGKTETFFTCEHCNYHYTTHVTDKRVRLWQEEKDQLRDADQRHNMQLRINKRMERLKDELING
ncbi:hypothetical protein ACQCT3_18050 [Sutcliffiella horikoshii]|uniref:hypothetical protein n=1 Tax=Sutcliffiella horikoshii TaxID=79883 RepID=UPI003CF7CA30